MDTMEIAIKFTPDELLKIRKLIKLNLACTSDQTEREMYEEIIRKIKLSVNKIYSSELVNDPALVHVDLDKLRRKEN